MQNSSNEHTPEDSPRRSSTKNLIADNEPCAVQKATFDQPLMESLGNFVEDKPLICDERNRVFPSKSSLARHVSSHGRTLRSSYGRTLRPCTKNLVADNEPCAVQKADFDQPLMESFGDPVICDECNRVFPSESSLASHVSSHRRKKAQVCDICKRRFARLRGLKTHMRVHSRVKTLPSKRSHKPAHVCDYCSKPLSSSFHLRTHMYIHTGRPFSCDQCPKTFCTPSDLKMHLRLHSTIRPYACDVCGKGYVRNDKLKAHLLAHSRQMPYLCSLCDNKTFPSVLDLQEHASEVHSDKKAFICEPCKKVKPRPCALSHAHHKCGRCSRVCSSAHLLRRHLLRHSDSRPHKCGECDRSFHDRSDLRKHEKIHTGVKPYVCEICNKSFHRRYNLKLHGRVHTGERPYVCDFCFKSFTYSTALRDHLCRAKIRFAK